MSVDKLHWKPMRYILPSLRFTAFKKEKILFFSFERRKERRRLSSLATLCDALEINLNSMGAES
jgi:hypothetical protein